LRYAEEGDLQFAKPERKETEGEAVSTRKGEPNLSFLL